MQISKREFLKRLGLGGAALAGGGLMADKYVPAKGQLPPGAIGDPAHLAWGRNIFPLEHTMTDGPSCSLVGGKVLQPAREIPIFHTTDVVVVGGGAAGFAAALAAARAGSKVALVERYGSLGGLFTNGMVLIMLSTSYREAPGRFRLVTKGLVTEFANRARALGSWACTRPLSEHKSGHWQPTVDPECAKYLMDRMVEEEKIDMFFHCWGVDTVQDGDKVLGVVFESKQGRQAILAKQVVDCTGDADVLFQAGGEYRQITHCIGHVVRLGNMDRITAKAPPRDADGKVKRGKWPLKSNEANPATWWGNTGPGPKGNGLNIRDLTAAEIGFRKEWWEHVSSMR
ncbi:MAG: FAD-dependent oxidoreductase, partial [Kiritimatiellae bacterium]|nr:FAD-dependent oxidoreductase [Kiritimatiellia bacterium]